MAGQQSTAAAKLDDEPLERRERRQVSLRGFAVRENGVTVEVLLLDLSYDGCGVEAPIAFAEGERLKLSVLDRGMIEARVRWCRDRRAGLIFETEEEASEPQHAPRRFDRAELSAEISMRRLGKLNYRVRVFDVSPAGCKLELVDKPHLKEHVLVKFEGLDSLEAEICWIEGPYAGVRFERPIHPAVFDLLVARLSSGAR